MDKSKPPGETDWKKTLVIIDLRFYGNATTSYPPVQHFTCFFSHYSGHLWVLHQKPWLTKYKAALRWSKIKKPFFYRRANMRMSFLWPDHFTYFTYFYILFHKLKDKTTFSLIPHYYGLSILGVSNNVRQLFIDLIDWWHGFITHWICFSVVLSSNPQLCM